MCQKPPLDSDTEFNGEDAVLLNELDAGTYTIELTSSTLDDVMDVAISTNQCSPSPISMGETVISGFTANCRSLHHRDNPFASYYTFTLDQAQSVTITSPSTTDFDAHVKVIAGNDIRTSPFDSVNTYYDHAVLLNNLDPGTYIIELTASNVDDLRKLSLSLNDCTSTPISTGETIQSSFTTDCRSTQDYDHDYASYYTLTLDQAQSVISIASPSTTNSDRYIRLFAGSDVSQSALDSNSIYNNDAVLVNHLDAGVYTIELSSSNLDDIIEISLSLNNCIPLSITVGDTSQHDFVADCRSILDYGHGYASYYTFTLDQTHAVLIDTPSTSNNSAYIRLFSGHDVSQTALDSISIRNDDAVILNNLDAGTYTIEVTSTNIDDMIAISLAENQCQAEVITTNFSTQLTFSSDCRSLRRHNHDAANYFEFTLDQTQTVSISSVYSGPNYTFSYLSLYTGTDVSIYPITSDTVYGPGTAMIQRNLTAGTYTIEVTAEDINATANLSVTAN